MAGRSILGDLAALLRAPAVRNDAPADVSGGGGFPGLSTSGMGTPSTAQLDAMSTSGMVFTVVNTIAEGVGAVEFGLFRKQTDGRRRNQAQDDRAQVTKHPALTVWERPNAFWTTSEFVEASIQHYELCGEWAWLVGRSGLSSMPLELWPVRPDRLIPVKHSTRFMEGWLYIGGGERIPLDLDQVIHTRRPNPKDPYRGLSPLAAGLTDLYGDEAAAVWNAMFFKNGAMPGGMIQFTESLADTEFKRFRRRWNEQHQGVNNAHKVALIEKGQWVDRKYTRKDMEFLDQRRFSQEQIRRAWRMPRPMLGDTDDINRANAEAGEVVFARWLVIPRARKLRGCLNTQFLPLFGDALSSSVEFDFTDPTPPDREADREDQNAAVERAKILVVDMRVEPAEAFEHEGLPAFTVKEPEPIPAALPPGAAPSDATEAPENRLALLQAHLEHRHEVRNVGGDADIPAADPKDDLQDAWQLALDALMANWPALKAEMIDAIIAAAEGPMAERGLDGLADLTVDTSRTADLLHASMVELGRAASAELVIGAAAAGVRISTSGPDPDQMRRAADQLARILGDRMVGTAKGAALRAWSTGNEARWPTSV